MIDLGKDINKLDVYLNSIVSGSKFQRLFIMHKENIIFKRKEYLRYSKKYLKEHKLYIFKIFKRYIIIKLF